MSIPKTPPCRRILLIAVPLFLNCILMLPQAAEQKDISEPSIPTFKASVEIVNAFVTVRDKKGAIIKDLTQEDFTLKEDGRKQTIRYFSRESDLPLTIGLIIDTSPSMQAVMKELQTASQIFLKNMIRPGKDRVFIIKFRDLMRGGMSFEGQVELVQGLTSSSETIERAANLIERNEVVGSSTNAGFQTMLADSICIASDKILTRVQGRKALIIIGDGFHIGDNMDLAVAAAHEGDALIYTIHIYDPDWGGSDNPNVWGRALGGMNRGGLNGVLGNIFRGGPMPQAGGFNPEASKKDLRTLSNKTGGAFFEGSGELTLGQIYRKIEEELRNQYSLGYEPSQSKNNDFRKIKVDVRRSGVIIHTREGYYLRPKP
jgi:VWFA-related protein